MNTNRNLIHDLTRRVRTLEDAFKFPAQAEEDGLGDLYKRVQDGRLNNHDAVSALYDQLDAILDHLGLEVGKEPSKWVVKPKEKE